MEELKHLTLPFEFSSQYTGIMHGIAGWFDLDLCGVTLTTAPSQPHTHWQQVRFLLTEPLALNSSDKIRGELKLDVNEHRSYDIHCHIEGAAKRQQVWKLHEQTYYYESYATDLSKPENVGLYAPDDESEISDMEA